MYKLSTFLVGCSSPLLRHWAQWWINHLSVTPGLKAPSQLASHRISLLCDQYQTTLIGDTGKFVWTTCPKSLPNSGMARSQTCDLLSHKSNTLTMTPLGHTLRNISINSTDFSMSCCLYLQGLPVRLQYTKTKIFWYLLPKGSQNSSDIFYFNVSSKWTCYRNQVNQATKTETPILTTVTYFWLLFCLSSCSCSCNYR